MAREGIELQKLQLQLESELSMASKQNVVCAILLCIVYTCSSASANSGAQQKPISVVLKGRVVCHACSLDEENFSDAGYIISGAVVAVECRAGLNRKTNAGLVSIEGKTDKNGEFKVELPGSIISSILLCSSSSDDHNPTLKGYCSARLLSSSPQEKCNVPSSTTSSSDRLIFTSDGNGIRTFTFPSLSYHSGSKLCSHKDITISSDHESLQAGRALHEVGTGSSSDKDALFPHGNLPPLPKSVLGFPPLDLPLPLPPLHFLNFPPLPLDLPIPLPPLPLDLPIPLPPLPLDLPFLNFPPLPVSVPPIPASISPLPAGIPFPNPPPFPSTIPSRFHKLP